MASVGAANGRNPRRVARHREPVVDCGADSAALDRRIARPVVSGDQKQHAIPGRNCPFETAIDRPPRSVEVHPVEIEHSIGLDCAVFEAPVPAAVEAGAMQILPGTGRGTMRSMVEGAACRTANPLHRLRRSPSPCGGGLRVARQGPDRRCDPGPEIGLVRAERAHALPHLSAAGSAPRPRPTFRRRSPPPRDLHPRRCRSGSGP